MFEQQVFRRRLLGHVLAQLRVHLPRPPRLSIRFSADMQFPYDVVIEPRGDGVQLTFGEVVLSAEEERKYAVLERCATMIFWFLQARDRPSRMVANLSDGHYLCNGRYVFATNSDSVTMLPDSYFFMRNGFEALRQQAETASIPWQDRE